MAKKVEEIIVARLLEKIEKDQKMPWQRPFVCASINWVTGKQYKGINRYLLDGGEYITPKQLDAYNKSAGCTYWFEKGTESEIVVYFGLKHLKVGAEMKKRIKEGELDPKGVGSLEEKDGEWYIKSWFLRYYRVYNVKDIFDKEGNALPLKQGVLKAEKVEEPEKLIADYRQRVGVQIQEQMQNSAYYQEDGDKVVIPPFEVFKGVEEYYRTIFHELAHSTGIATRMNRLCYKEYAAEDNEARSREELIAELTAHLLSIEVGYTNTVAEGNSDSYILSWLTWLRNNPQEIIRGMQESEKVCQYILGRPMWTEKDA